MPQPCRTCTHADRAAIEAGVMAGASIDAVARHYGLAPISLRRHIDNHVPLVLRQASAIAAQNDDKQADIRKALTTRMDVLARQTETILSRAIAEEKYAASALLIRECRSNLELLFKWQVPAATPEEFTNSAGYIAFRRVLMTELRAHPEIRDRIADAMLRLEEDGTGGS